MYLPFVKKNHPASRNIRLTALLTPLLCLASPTLLSAAEKLFLIESPATQEQIVSHAGPQLKAAIDQPYVEEFVLAQVDPSVVAEQSNDIEINLTQGCSIMAHKIRVERVPPDMLVWEGERPNQKRRGYLSPNEIPVDLENSVTLVRHNYNITGLVRVNGETYQITPVENGEHAIIKVDTRKFPQGHDVLIPPGYERECSNHYSLPAQIASARSTIRIVVPVSLQVQQRVNDVPALVTLAFSLLNQAATNSGVDVTFQNAGILNTSFNDNTGGGYISVIQSLSDRNNPTLGRPAHAFREANRAHLIAMLTSRNELCGQAWRPATLPNNITSVTSYFCISGELVFNHELGHNFDVQHDWENSGQQPPRYAHGYQQNRVAPFWRTIMAYNCNRINCPLINNFSNPNRTFNGIPTGHVNYANGVRRINELRHVIETFTHVMSAPFRLENRQVPGRCLDVLGGNPNTIGVFGCQANNSNQTWVADSGGFIRLNSNQNLCLSGNGNGGFVTLQNCTSANQRLLWQISNENYINAANRECLNPLDNAASAARVNTALCTNANLQRWTRVPNVALPPGLPPEPPVTPPPPPPVISEPFNLENRQVRGQCLDVLAGNPQAVGVFTCANNANQRWVSDNTGRILQEFRVNF